MLTRVKSMSSLESGQCLQWSQVNNFARVKVDGFIRLHSSQVDGFIRVRSVSSLESSQCLH